MECWLQNGRFECADGVLWASHREGRSMGSRFVRFGAR
jgi:hypothetical protein